MRRCVSPDGQKRMEIERITMGSLAQQLTPMLDRPVFDHTELKGQFTIALEFSKPDIMQMARASGAGAGVPIGGPVR